MSLSLNAPASGMSPGATILIDVGEVALFSYGSVTFGFPLVAPEGTSAVTL